MLLCPTSSNILNEPSVPTSLWYLWDTQMPCHFLSHCWRPTCHFIPRSRASHITSPASPLTCFQVWTYPSFFNKKIIGRQIQNKFRSWLGICNKSPCACEQLNVLNGNFYWRFCDVFFDPCHNTNPWNCLVFKQIFHQDINTFTPCVKKYFHIQDWADFRVRTNPPSRSGCFLRFRGCVYSRHAVCITSDSSLIVMKNCPFPISFKKPAPEDIFDNFWSSRSSANFGP